MLDTEQTVETPVEDVVIETTPVEEAETELSGETEQLDSSLVEAGQMNAPAPAKIPEEEPEEEELPPTPETGEVTEEPTEAEPVEPIVFDPEADLPVVLEKVNEVLDKYELPEDVQAAFNALKSKAEFVPVVETPEIVTQLADYGDVETVKATLDRANHLTSVTINEDGSVRPNTDKWVQDIVANDPDTAAWVYYDIATSPSTMYEGLTKFEEGICNALGVEGDTIGTVLARYQTMMANAKSAAMISDIPEFIPSNLHQAYRLQPRETREEIAALVPDDDGNDYFANDRSRKLTELTMIQKGLDAEAREQQALVQAKQEQQLAFNRDIQTVQSTFYGQMRDVFTENLLKEVVFSTDPKLQNLLAKQQVTTITQAFSPDSDGEYARKALEEAGIKFDYQKAQTLTKAIEDASIALTVAKRQVTSDGKQLNQVELNRATRKFEEITTAMQEFAADILKQEQQLTSTGKAEEIKTEVAKQKLQPKARPTTKAVGTPVTKEASQPAYRSQEWYDKYAEERMREMEARKASAYQ